MTASQTVGARRQGRIAGVDLARGIAVLGMFAAHFNPGQLDPDDLLHQLVSGRAAVLFAVLAGVSVSLLTGGSAGPRPGDRRGLATRAGVLFVLGLALTALGTTVKEILTVYALLFLLAIPLLRVRSALLAVAAGVLAVAGPLVSFLLRSGPVGSGTPGRTPSFTGLFSPEGLADTVTGLLLDGTYPVLTWLPFLLTGMVVGRCDLRSAVVQRWLILGGALLAALTLAGSWLLTGPGGGFSAIATALGVDGTAVRSMAEAAVGVVPAEHPGFLLIATPHSGAPLEILSSTGCALAVLGVSLAVAGRAPRLLAPFASVGKLALTSYAGHIVLIAVIGVPGMVDLLTRYGHWPLLVILAATLLLATIWTRLVGRGPLETLVGSAATAVRRTADRRGVLEGAR